MIRSPGRCWVMTYGMGVVKAPVACLLAGHCEAEAEHEQYRDVLEASPDN